MKRWIIGLALIALASGAGITGFGVLAGAQDTGLDCSDPKHANNKQCESSFTEPGGSSSTKGCDKSNPGKNPHCKTVAAGDDDDSSSDDTGGNNTTQSTLATTSDDGTTPTTAGGEAETVVAGAVEEQPQADGAEPAEPTEAQPSFTG